MAEILRYAPSTNADVDFSGVDLDASNSFTYLAGTSQTDKGAVLHVRNDGVASCDIVITGSTPPPALDVDGGGVVNYADGYQFTVPAGSTTMVPLYRNRKFMQGTITMTSTLTTDVKAYIADGI